MSQPLIGLTLDSEPGGGWSAYPWHAIRQNYFTAIADAGGLPVGIGHDPAQAEAIVARLDGLVVTGGAFDVDPALYGDAARHPTVTLKDRRTATELALLRAALARDIPVLGICGGQQLMAVALGGTLHQHVPDAVPGALAHEQPNPRHEAGHGVAISPGSRLADIVGTETLEVNSAHHQAVATAGPALRVNAVAADGVIEGVEHPRHRFCVGVQWHPEFLVNAGDRALMAAFVAASRHE